MDYKDRPVRHSSLDISPGIAAWPGKPGKGFWQAQATVGDINIICPGLWLNIIPSVPSPDLQFKSFQTAKRPQQKFEIG
jgi:hypothetical protein